MTILDLLSDLAQSTEQPNWPVFVGHCHSYDHSSGEENLRRIRMTYVAPDGKLTVSPLLFRCAMSPGTDYPVPTLQSLVVGLWTRPERTAGVYLGFVQNEPLVTNESQTHDYFELIEGILTIRARHVRIVTEDGIELMTNVEQPNYSHVEIGGEATSDQASHIKFRDGFGCEITIREIFNAVKLDESPDL